jgi:hypothetical protein
MAFALINTPLWRGGKAAANSSDLFSGFNTVKTAEAVTFLLALHLTSLKRGVNESL